MQCIEKVRLWFSYRSSRTQADALKQDGQTRDIPGFVETESELTWTDDTRKRGGLKFKNLSAEARSQIRDWIRQPSLANASEKSTASFPSVYKRPVLNAKGAETTAAAADSPRLDSSRSHALRFDLSRFDALSRHIRSGKLWTGFSGGLMAGVLVSAIVVSVFMLMSHGRELGDSLIRLGERLGGRSWVALPEQRSAATELKPVSLESKMTAAQPQTFAVPEQVQRPQAKEYVSANLPAPAKLAADKIDPDRLAKAAREATNPHVIPGSFSLSGPTEPNHSAVNPTGSRPLSPDIVVAPVPEPSANLFPATAARWAPTF